MHENSCLDQILRKATEIKLYSSNTNREDVLLYAGHAVKKGCREKACTSLNLPADVLIKAFLETFPFSGFL
jgi:hypothetical protein